MVYSTHVWELDTLVLSLGSKKVQLLVFISVLGFMLDMYISAYHQRCHCLYTHCHRLVPVYCCTYQFPCMRSVIKDGVWSLARHLIINQTVSSLGWGLEITLWTLVTSLQLFHSLLHHDSLMSTLVGPKVVRKLCWSLLTITAGHCWPSPPVNAGSRWTLLCSGMCLLLRNVLIAEECAYCWGLLTPCL